MATALRKNWLWLLVSGIDLALFAYFSSWCWAPHGEEGLVGGPGDAFIWAYTALPLLALSVPLNLIWLVAILAGLHWPTKWRLLLLWSLIVSGWVGTVMYNKDRSYTGAELYSESPIP